MTRQQTQNRTFQMPQEGDVLEGRYRITSVLATGGMGLILQAEHLRMGRQVAVKVLHPHIAQDAEVIARFEREVQLAQGLNHPNTIRLYDFGEADSGLVYVVMELLEGEDLKEVLAREGSLPVGRAIELSLQVLDGLGEAHEQDFVHRDLKPSNIFVCENRRGEDLVKLLDFGIAKSLEESGADLTKTGSICGTAAYVAPEYLYDPTPTKSADVYAVGLILLEMLTGKRVFHGTTTAQTLMMQMQRDVKIPRHLAQTPLGEVIERAASKEPARRFADADHMFQALAAIRDELPADLRLDPVQVGDVLEPAAMAGPGWPGRGSETPSTGSLPQAPHTPAGGERIRPQPPNIPQTRPDRADVTTGSLGDFSGEKTVVTGGAQQEFPQAKTIVTAGSPEQFPEEQTLVTPVPELGTQEQMPALGAAERDRGVNKLVWVGAAAGLAMVGVLAIWIFSGSDASSQVAGEDESAVAAQEEKQPSEGPAEDGTLADEDEAVEQVEEAAAEPGWPGEPYEPVELVEIRVESAPAGASVYLEGEDLGHTPMELSFDPDELPQPIRIERDGYAAVELDVTADSESTLNATLEPVAAPQTESKGNDRTDTRRSSPTSRPSKPADESVDEFLDELL